MDERDQVQEDHVIEVKDLTKTFPIVRGFLRRVVGHVRAVNNVSFNVRRGETLALVGESGSGKTTTGRCILRAVEPLSGKVLFRPTPDASPIDIVGLSERELRYIQRYLGMIFQDPFSSLNPRLTVLDIIGEPFVTRKLVRNHRDLENKVADLLRSVHLDPAYMRRYPHAFSGGQRQRIAIARALALNPPFIVADEPVSALDVSVQAQILRLLKELQRERHLTYLFITHNLAVVEFLSDRVAVMYVGNIVELGDNADVFSRPRHPYTEALLSAVPVINTDQTQRREHIVLQGDVADPANVPKGCHFHPRCKYAEALCREQEPEFINVAEPGGAPHYARCHFAKELHLRGVESMNTSTAAVRPFFEVGTSSNDLEESGERKV